VAVVGGVEDAAGLAADEAAQVEEAAEGLLDLVAELLVHPEVDDGVVADGAHGHEVADEEDVGVVEGVVARALVRVAELDLVDGLRDDAVDAELVGGVLAVGEEGLEGRGRVVGGRGLGAGVQVAPQQGHVGGHQAVHVDGQPAEQEERDDDHHDFDGLLQVAGAVQA